MNYMTLGMENMLTISLAIIGTVIVLYAQLKIQSNYRKYKMISCKKNLTGFDVARMILDQNVLNKFIDIVKNKDKNTDNDDILLTKQERNILELISEGKTNKEISIELYVAEKTVRNYVSTILKKINVDNRTEAAMYWIRQKSLI